MGFLDSFRSDATATWPDSRPSELRLDLATGGLNGVLYAAPYESLQVFGRPTNRGPIRSREFHYPELGLSVWTDGEGFATFEVHFRALNVFGIEEPLTRDPLFAPGRVRLSGKDGREFDVSAATTWDELVQILGPITLEERDADYSLASFKRLPWTLEFEFSVSGDLHTLRAEPGDPLDPPDQD